jgi:hypothetical protein
MNNGACVQKLYEKCEIKLVIWRVEEGGQERGEGIVSLEKGTELEEGKDPAREYRVQDQ